jgi:hypothetical protein
MRVRELAQRWHGDMAQEVGWIEDFQGGGSS